jgi:rRNA maturation endonuclease Nob1
MATLIRRNEALKRINQLEEKAREAGKQEAIDWIAKCFNAIMSCKVEERVFCAKCGKPVKIDKIPDGAYVGGAVFSQDK